MTVTRGGRSLRPAVSILLSGLEAGGSVRSAIRLANGIAGRDCSVHLVVVRERGGLEHEVSPSVHVEWLGAVRLRWSLFKIVAYLRRERPMVVLCVGDELNVMALIAGRIARVPAKIVVTEHNTLSLRSTESLLSKRLMPIIVRWSYPTADAIIAVSSGVADDLARVASLERSRIHVIYNPVVSETIRRSSHMPLDDPWFTGDGPPVVLAVGRFVQQKDFSTLIEAFSIVRSRRSVRLLILGDGPERSSLEELVIERGLADSVRMPGVDLNPFRYMARAAVLALSSRWEGLPSVLIEAMACGCPVVSTDCPSGPREILSGGALGPLVAVGDGRALAKALEDRLDTPRDSIRLQERAQDFGVAPSVDQHLSVLLPGLVD